MASPFPDIFLAQSHLHGEPLWIDAFDGGRFIAKEELVEALGRVPATTRDRVLAPASVIEICARILRNVVTSLERAEDIQRHRRAVKWLGDNGFARLDGEKLPVWMKQRIDQGESPDSVRRWLVARYGDYVTYDPPLSWVTAPLWLAPLVMLGIGAWLARGSFKRKTR